MGLGIKRKINYFRSLVESIFIRYLQNTRGSNFGTPKVEEYGCWYIKKDDLKTFLHTKGKEILQEADLVVSHQFDILGTGLQFWGDPIEWNLDIKNSHRWPLHYYKLIIHKDLTGTNGSDIKIPWELSRFQYIAPLIKAYILNGNQKYSLEGVNQILNWMDKNPFLYGVNWTCAMEVAIRSCNWIWAWWAFKDDPAWTDMFNQRFLKSLWQHGWYIEHNLENNGGIRTNHYLSDVIGLLFIGIMFPQFKDSARWKEFGFKELIRSMDEMVYPDGVSFENSIAYHRLLLELFCYAAILCQRNGIELPQLFLERLERMFDFIMYCIRPDGHMPMIGDSDDGRFFILSDYYNWDRWDHRYLVSVGAVLFNRSDYKTVAAKFHEETFWLLGKEGFKKFQEL